MHHFGCHFKAHLGRGWRRQEATKSRDPESESDTHNTHTKATVYLLVAMLVRLRALDVVLGRSPRPESSTDRKEAKRAKATRLRIAAALAREGLGPTF
jgi:hypothetical protein